MSNHTPKAIPMNPIRALLLPSIVRFLDEKHVVVDISPELATALLAYNTLNRHPRQNDVIAHRRAMMADGWNEKIGCLAFHETTNALADGQHRLMAIAGLPADMRIRMEARWDADDHYRNNVDTGIARSAADVFGLNKLGLNHAKASIVRELISRQAGRAGTKITPQEHLSYVLDHAEEINVAVARANRIYERRGFSRAVMGASLVEFAWQDVDKAAEFARLVTEGDHPGSVVALFLDRIGRDYRKLTKEQRRDLLASTWKKWLKGRGGSPRTHRRAERNVKAAQ